MDINFTSPRTGRLLKEDGTHVNEAETIDGVKNASRVTSVWNGYKTITKTGFSVPANGDDKISWLDDTDVQGAKLISVFYTADQSHNITLMVAPSIPALVGYYKVSEGEYGNLPAGSRCATFPINTANVQIYFHNNNGAAVLAISNIVIRLQF